MLKLKLEVGKIYTIKIAESRNKVRKVKATLIAENNHIWIFRKSDGLIESFCKNSYPGEISIQGAAR